MLVVLLLSFALTVQAQVFNAGGVTDDFSDGVVSPYWQPEHSEDDNPPIVVSESDNTLEILIDKSMAAEAGSETYGFSALLFNFEVDQVLNMATNCFGSVKIKTNAALPFEIGVADSASGGNNVTITNNIEVAEEFITLYFNFRGLFNGQQDSSKITKAYLNFKPGYGAGGVYQGTVWLKDFKMGTHAELPLSAGMTEDFNEPVDLDTWAPSKGTHEDGTPIFNVTQEENALKVEMKQLSFPDGQHYNFGNSYNLDASRFASIRIKLEEGALYNGGATATIPFSMTPWDTLRQHSDIIFNVPADGQWNEYTFDWTEDDADQETNPNDYANIFRFLLETVTWPNTYEATFWIDDFSFGEEAPNAVDPELLNSVPVHYALSQNYPNPFNPVTQIYYTLPEAGHVLLEVFDMTGRSVGVLVDQMQTAGQHQLTYNASDLASGIYILHLKSSTFNAYKRMTLLK